MRQAVAVTLILLSITVLCRPLPAAAAAWICEAESGSGSASAGGVSRREAENRALGYCAANSARFAACRIITCRRER